MITKLFRPVTPDAFIDAREMKGGGSETEIDVDDSSPSKMDILLPEDQR